jgi:hypothetical protein
MKMNKIISKILLILIVISFLYIVFHNFKRYEGFNTEPPITDPSTINPGTITDPNTINPGTITINPGTITNPSTITDPTIINPGTIIDPSTINPNIQPDRFQMLNNNLETVYNTTVDISDNLYKVSNNINYKLNDISDNMFSDYDASRNFYNSSGNMISQILTKLNDLTLKINTTTNLKCVANFGTKIGEPLSGGKGVLTDTRYICPEEMPSCAGMMCDEKYGVCTKE